VREIKNDEFSMLNFELLCLKQIHLLAELKTENSTFNIKSVCGTAVSTREQRPETGRRRTDDG
jgi:hypothetical protein